MIVLSDCEFPDAVRKAVDAGASGIIVETASPEFPRHAIGAAVRGYAFAVVRLVSIGEHEAAPEESTRPAGRAAPRT